MLQTLGDGVGARVVREGGGVVVVGGQDFGVGGWGSGGEADGGEGVLGEGGV